MIFIISPIIFFSIFLYHVYNNFFSSDIELEDIIDPITDYINRNKTLLLNTFKTDINMSAQIEEEFYDKKEYNGVMRRDKNDIELRWKTNILYENTPKGPIIMHYDAYKQGFTYYTDQTCMPFVILNAVAMKYVVRFFCRDFYYDEETYMIEDIQENEEQQLSENNEEQNKERIIMKLIDNVYVSPLFKIHNKKDETNKTKELKKILNDAPMAKFKKTSTGSSDPKKKKAPKEYITNRYIYMGKMNNFNILQKKSKNKSNTKTSYDAMFNNSKESIIATKMSYKDYKHRKQD